MRAFAFIHLFPSCHSERVLPSSWKQSFSVPFLLLLACAVPVLGGFHLQTYWSYSVPQSVTQFLNVYCHTDFISVGSLRPQLCSKSMWSSSIYKFIITLSYGVNIILVVYWLSYSLLFPDFWLWSLLLN